jgi:hypothetical protein
VLSSQKKPEAPIRERHKLVAEIEEIKPSTSGLMVRYETVETKGKYVPSHLREVSVMFEIGRVEAYLK